MLIVLGAVLLAGSLRPVRGEDAPVEFKGYTRAAEMIVEKFLQAVGKLSTYSDDAVIKMEMGVSFARQEMEASFVYAKPRRFRIRTQQHDICSDGKELTAHMKGMRRYTVSPLEEDVGKQVARYFGGMGISFGIGDLILAKDVRKQFAEQFQNMDLGGYEEIDGDRCVVLRGTMSSSVMRLGEGEVPVKLWIRESDMMLRKAEVDLLELMKKQFEDNDAMVMPFKEYKTVYDVRDLRLNPPLEEDAFQFDPPPGSKKVEKFYSSEVAAGDTAMQFELSGKPAPAFDLPTAAGARVALDDLLGKVVVLNFLPRWPVNQTHGLTVLDEIQRDYADKPVRVVSIHGGASAEKLMDKVEGKELDLTIALDSDGAARAQYFEDRFRSGIILVNKDGIVQGRYAGPAFEEMTESLRKDIDKLLAGETLPGAAVMTEEQLEEAAIQRSARYTAGSTEDPVHEERLAERWSVRASGGGDVFSIGGRRTAGQQAELWLRDRGVVRRISPEGETTAEIPLPDPSYDDFSQDAFVAGTIGRRLGVVYMKAIPGEEEQFGYRPPKQVVIKASDESGQELWKFEFDVKNFQIPGHLTLADVDGRPGDEFLFVHQAALWVVDDRGEVIVRKPISGSVQWMVVDDRDHDRRAEVYLRSSTTLTRYDYRP